MEFDFANLPRAGRYKLMAHGEVRLKDTASNIRRTGEFVVNIVSEEHAEAMNATCIDAPLEVSEVDLAGLTLAAIESKGRKEWEQGRG